MNYSKLLTMPLLFIAFTIPGQAAMKAVENGSGDTLFWIVLTVILTLVFAMRGTIKLLMNPVYLVVFIVLMFVIYIIFSAIMLVYDVGASINDQIQNVANMFPR